MSGLPTPSKNDEVWLQKKSKTDLLRLIFNFVLLFFLLSSHLRIARFRKYRNNSYFSTSRKNIATFNQTLLYAYIKCAIQFAKVVHLMTLYLDNDMFIHIPCAIVGKYTSIICKTSHTIFDNMLDCILFPGWMFMSTRKEFPELWIRERDNNNVHECWKNDFFTPPVPRRDINTKNIYNDFIVKMASNRSRKHLHHNLVVPTIMLNGVPRLTGVEM